MHRPDEFAADFLQTRQAPRSVTTNGLESTNPYPDALGDPGHPDNGRRCWVKTQMPCHDDTVFISGEVYYAEVGNYRSLRELADKRQLDATSNLPAVMDMLYQQYEDGYIIALGNQHDNKKT